MSSAERTYTLIAVHAKRELLDKFLIETAYRVERLAEELETGTLTGKDVLWRLQEIKDACAGIRVYTKEM